MPRAVVWTAPSAPPSSAPASVAAEPAPDAPGARTPSRYACAVAHHVPTGGRLSVVWPCVHRWRRWISNAARCARWASDAGCARCARVGPIARATEHAPVRALARALVEAVLRKEFVLRFLVERAHFRIRRLLRRVASAACAPLSRPFSFEPTAAVASAPQRRCLGVAARRVGSEQLRPEARFSRTASGNAAVSARNIA